MILALNGSNREHRFKIKSTLSAAGFMTLDARLAQHRFTRMRRCILGHSTGRKEDGEQIPQAQDATTANGRGALTSIDEFDKQLAKDPIAAASQRV